MGYRSVNCQHLDRFDCCEIKKVKLFGIPLWNPTCCLIVSRYNECSDRIIWPAPSTPKGQSGQLNLNKKSD